MVFIQMVPVPLVTKCATLYMYVLIRVMANPRYICSLTILSILSSSSHPYSFPSHSLTSSPISLSIHFHFPHFPLSLNPFPTFPTLAAHSPYPHSHSSFPHIHPTTSYNPHTPTLHPLPHVFLISTHTRSVIHVVRSCIHILILSYSLITFPITSCST